MTPTEIPIVEKLIQIIRIQNGEHPRFSWIPAEEIRRAILDAGMLVAKYRPLEPDDMFGINPVDNEGPKIVTQSRTNTHENEKSYDNE